MGKTTVKWGMQPTSSIHPNQLLLRSHEIYHQAIVHAPKSTKQSIKRNRKAMQTRQDTRVSCKMQECSLSGESEERESSNKPLAISARGLGCLLQTEGLETRQ